MASAYAALQTLQNDPMSSEGGHYSFYFTLQKLKWHKVDDSPKVN